MNVLHYARDERNGSNFVKVVEPELFNQILENFGVVLRNEFTKYDLSSIYDVGVHLDSGALLIANKGATLFCLSPRTHSPYITRHIGCCIYFPGLGIEVANIGLVGDVYNGPVLCAVNRPARRHFFSAPSAVIVRISGTRSANWPLISIQFGHRILNPTRV